MNNNPPFFRYELEDHVVTITFDRVDKLNAFTRVMAGNLVGLIDRADRDEAVRAIILTGAGRAFCAGADLSGGTSFGAPPDEASQQDAWRDFGGLITLRLFDCLKPVIVAFNGPAAGMGVTLALAADYRLATTTAKFALPFVRRGIVPESCSSWFLPRLVGLPRALDWMLSGRTFGAEEALVGGLVRSLHAPDELMDAARSIARPIATEGAPVSVALTRQMLWHMAGAAHPMDAHRIESKALFQRFGSADTREGMASFIEKRPPQFPGRSPSDLPDGFPWWPDPPFHRE